MARYKITAPDGNSYVVTAPETASQDEVLNYAKQNYQKSSIFPNALKDLDLYKVISQAAPSNLGKIAGIGVANAPGYAGAALGSVLPGNSGQIMPGIQNIKKDPSQIVAALKRILAVQGGGQMTPRETTLARIGQIGGMALEVAATPGLGTENIKPKSPFMAGVKSPSTAIPGEFEEAGAALGEAKTAARAGESPVVAARLRGLLSKPSGVQKLAEEGKTAMEAGKDSSVAELLAYREALGKMQSEGGVFADDYAKAKNLASQMLKEKAPDLVSKLERMATNYAARGNPKAGFPWFTFALNPEVGAMKATTLPAVQNAAGAAVSPLVTRPGAIASVLRNILQDRRVKNLLGQ